MNDNNQNIFSLKESLKDWIDIDFAQHKLAVCLGIFPNTKNSFLENKGFYWSANHLGVNLWLILMMLVNLNILEYNKEEMQVRWNPNWTREEVENGDPNNLEQLVNVILTKYD